MVHCLYKSNSCIIIIVPPSLLVPGERESQYSVVFLTDDRNLRVKALAHGLPVRDLPEFMRLANIKPSATPS